MVDLQRREGSLVPYSSTTRRRVLLPAEAALCNALGLSEDEYWYFVELTDAYNGKRAEAYDLAGVPDVVNIPVVPLVVSLVVGIAVSAVGAALTPKPRGTNATQPTQPEVIQQQQKIAPQLRTNDIQGSSRYATNSGFDSVQALASLGEVIPLVFANRVGNVGGIRIKTVLLWSQLLSFGAGQQLKILTLLSAGELAAEPEFAGFAIGDQTLKNYTLAKVGLYRRLMGGRIQEGDRYPQGTISANPVNDIFTVYDDSSRSYKTWFCGNRTTSTQTQFGCYSPMPNATPYRLPYELIMNQRNLNENIRRDNDRKRQKIEQDWRTLAGINSADATTCTYYIHGGSEPPNNYPPYGLSDVNKATEDRRTSADTSIQVGGLYMAGSAHVVCISASTDEPWTLGMEKAYTFRIEEPGEIPTFDIYKYGINNPTYGYVLQRLAIGTVSNNRECHITELGIKSNVWKQISGFPNVNSHPSPLVVQNYENLDGNIQLGNVQRYITRYSFFRLEVRPLGRGQEWQDISGGTLFCVQGNSPQDMYNFIRIIQPFGQYEYRVVPYPGAAVVDKWNGRNVYRLTPGALIHYAAGEFAVSFSGQQIEVTRSRMTNSDWTVGVSTYGRGPVRDISPKSPDGRVRPPVYEDSSNSWITPPWFYSSIVDTSSNAGGSGLKVKVNFLDGYDEDGNYFIFSEWEVAQGGDGYKDGDQVTFDFNGTTYTVTVSIIPTPDPYSLIYWDAVADIGQYDAERFSHENGPEHELVYVNEIIHQNTAPQYDNMALIGLRLNASKEWASFQQLSAYVKKGIMVDRLIDDDGAPTTTLRGPTNNFAEIAYTLLTNDRLGAGELLGVTATNRERMTKAAQFCRANGFTWDGVIGQKLNLRNFIFDNAGYCLLDFTILGGQFSLMPSVPVTSNHKIDNAAQPLISALFTDGNIRDLTVSWLSPEERQLFKAVVKWRKETDNGFSQERLFTMRLSDAQGGSDSDGEEVFDLSAFCTTREQGEVFAKYALKLRKEVDHGLKFQTTPQSAMGLEPGAYFRLVSEVTHTSRFNNGSIDSGGFITSTQTMADGTYNVLTWQPGTVGVSEDQMTVSGGKAQNAGLFGRVFTLKNSTTTSRVYKVESLSYGEEGFVEIAGSYQPLTATGSLATLDWTDNHFVIEVG